MGQPVLLGDLRGHAGGFGAGHRACLGAVGLATELTDVQHGLLNVHPKSVDVIRRFPASGIVLWGARTLSSDPEWKYISPRRMAIFLQVPGTETVEFTTDLPLTYLVLVSALTYRPAVVDLDSDVPLIRWNDPDDGVTVALGDDHAGMFDYPGDNDWYEISLREGQTISIVARSILALPDIIVDVPENELDPLGFDAGSGGGLFGTDSRLEFTATETRTYLIGIQDGAFFGPGGYRLTIGR